jgi:hypothetical protein
MEMPHKKIPGREIKDETDLKLKKLNCAEDFNENWIKCLKKEINDFWEDLI